MFVVKIKYSLRVVFFVFILSCYEKDYIAAC